MRVKYAIGLGMAVASAALGAACDSSNATPPRTGDAASASSGSTSGSSTDAATDSSNAPGSDGGATTLYQRLGGHAGIRAAINAIVAQELMDTNIQTYFFNQVASPIPAGHPTADQIEECFTDQLGAAAMGPEMYPTTVVSDAGSFTCRDMTTIHAPLKISGGTFDKFVMIAGGVLMTAKGTGPYTYTSADIDTVAGVLTGAKPVIVDSNQADAGLQPFPGPDAQ